MELDERKKRERLEIRSALILALATMSITWCTYQNRLWGGIQVFRLAEANKQSRLSQQEITLAAQRQQVDVTIAMDFMNAVLKKDQQKIHYYQKRGKSELVNLLNDWYATDPLNNEKAPPHPLAMPNYERLNQSFFTRSDSFAVKSQQAWEKAEKANENADNYVLVTVVLSLVLFIGAISIKMTSLSLANILVNFSSLICLAMIIILVFVMPVTRGN